MEGGVRQRSLIKVFERNRVILSRYIMSNQALSSQDRFDVKTLCYVEGKTIVRAGVPALCGLERK